MAKKSFKISVDGEIFNVVVEEITEGPLPLYSIQ